MFICLICLYTYLVYKWDATDFQSLHELRYAVVKSHRSTFFVGWAWQQQGGDGSLAELYVWILSL